MKTTDKATPRPWKAAEAEQMDKGLRIFSLGDAEIAPATAYGDTKKQRDKNAELIVRAVNTHDELVEVCKAIEDSGFLSDKNGDDSGGHLLADLRQALTNAQ